MVIVRTTSSTRSLAALSILAFVVGRTSSERVLPSRNQCLHVEPEPGGGRIVGKRQQESDLSRHPLGQQVGTQRGEGGDQAGPAVVVVGPVVEVLAQRDIRALLKGCLRLPGISEEALAELRLAWDLEQGRLRRDDDGLVQGYGCQDTAAVHFAELEKRLLGEIREPTPAGHEAEAGDARSTHRAKVIGVIDQVGGAVLARRDLDDALDVDPRARADCAGSVSCGLPDAGTRAAAAASAQARPNEAIQLNQAPPVPPQGAGDECGGPSESSGNQANPSPRPPAMSGILPISSTRPARPAGSSLLREIRARADAHGCQQRGTELGHTQLRHHGNQEDETPAYLRLAHPGAPAMASGRAMAA